MQRLVLTLLVSYAACCLAQEIPASTHYSNGLSRYKSKDFKAAVSDFTQAIKLEPGNAEAYYQRGRAYYELKYNLQAINEFNRTIELNPKHSKAYYIRGYVKFLMKNYQAAVSDFNFAVEINPKSALAFFYRGEAKNELGEVESACIDWTNAMELGYYNAKDYISKYCEGLNLSSQKFIDNILINGDHKFNNTDFQGALIEYNKAVNLDPEYAPSYVNRGLVNLILGSNEKACVDWNKAMELRNSEAKDLYEQHCN